ncbi:MAG: hypothetical protein WD771_03630 [Gemmatimonadaceae bacterium]
MTLAIDSLSAGGDGVGRSEGLVVFTPRTAPGDRVSVDITVQGRVGRGRLRRVESAGPARVTPRCAHYAAPDRCGGCQWQQVAIGAQREAKRLIVRDAFARIAKRTVELPPIHGGAEWRYRRSLTLAIRRPAGGAVFAGLRAFDDPEAVFKLDDCEITVPAVLATWRTILSAGAYLPAEPRLRGTVREVDGLSYFTLEGGRAWPEVAQFLDAVPALAAVWWHADGRHRRLIADRRPASAPGASFVQVNAEVAAMLQADVVARVMACGPRTVVDAYSGAGDTAAALAANGVNVVAIEADEEATAWAASRLPAGSRAIAARVEDVIARVLPTDVVILNPPRSGVDAKVTAALGPGAAAAKAIVYVSCDPATLARDVARLAGWRVHALACYDLFPQTSHVETVCELRPEAA